MGERDDEVGPTPAAEAGPLVQRWEALPTGARRAIRIVTAILFAATAFYPLAAGLFIAMIATTGCFMSCEEPSPWVGLGVSLLTGAGITLAGTVVGGLLAGRVPQRRTVGRIAAGVAVLVVALWSFAAFS